MDALGINWFYLLAQIAICLAIPVFIALVLFFVKAKKSSKSLVRFVGLLTALMTILSVVFVLAWVSMFVFSLLNPSAGFDAVFKLYNSIPVKVLGMVTVVVTISLMAYYIPHAAQSPFLPKDDRIYYQVGLFFLPFIMMPMYYLKYIKDEPDAIQKA